MMDPDPVWMLPESAMSWIESTLPNGAHILEFGSGHGTDRLARRFEMLSVEHDAEWVERCPTPCIHAPIEENATSFAAGEQGWYRLSVVLESIPTDLDLVIVDGPPGSIGRTGLLQSLHALPSDVPFIVDDVHRQAESALFMQLEAWHSGSATWHWMEHDGIAKGRAWGILMVEGGQ
jgi:hypothetical protein